MILSEVFGLWQGLGDKRIATNYMKLAFDVLHCSLVGSTKATCIDSSCRAIFGEKGMSSKELIFVR
jgi:hypothetical protein